MNKIQLTSFILLTLSFKSLAQVDSLKSGVKDTIPYCFDVSLSKCAMSSDERHKQFINSLSDYPIEYDKNKSSTWKRYNVPLPVFTEERTKIGGAIMGKPGSNYFIRISFVVEPSDRGSSPTPVFRFDNNLTCLDEYGNSLRDTAWTAVYTQNWKNLFEHSLIGIIPIGGFVHFEFYTNNIRVHPDDKKNAILSGTNKYFYCDYLTD